MPQYMRGPVAADDREFVALGETEFRQPGRKRKHFLAHLRPGPFLPNPKRLLAHRRPVRKLRGVAQQEFGESVGLRLLVLCSH